MIKLKDGVGLLPTVLDIVENPKNLKIVELEAPQLPRSLDDAQIALAVINTTYASQIGLTPAKDGIFVEDKDSPYVNLIVTREDNKDAENVKNSFRLTSLMKFTKQQTRSLTAALLKAGNFSVSQFVISFRTGACPSCHFYKHLIQ